MAERKMVTSGDVREFLANVALGVKNGDVKITEASHIAKVAAQIHESFYSEIKIARVRKELGLHVAELGTLKLNV